MLQHYTCVVSKMQPNRFKVQAVVTLKAYAAADIKLVLCVH